MDNEMKKMTIGELIKELVTSRDHEIVEAIKKDDLGYEHYLLIEIDDRICGGKNFDYLKDVAEKELKEERELNRYHEECRKAAESAYDNRNWR